MRVLVTGSREFTDIELLWGVLDAITEGSIEVGDTFLTLVHGAHRPKLEKGVRPRKSADWLAHLWVSPATARYGRHIWIEEEPHPAKWRIHAEGCPEWCPKRSYCSFAGFRRNDVMVRRGADIVPAFLVPGAKNSGTRHCMRSAEGAGLTVVPYSQREAS